MTSIRILLVALLSLAPEVRAAADLLVSHYSGYIYGLSLTTNSTGGGSLAITQQLQACGSMPSWLTLDSASGNLYCVDEAEYGSPVLTNLAVGSDGTVKSVVTARSTGGELHSSLYGGSNGKGYIAVAEYDLSSISYFKLPLNSSSTALAKLTFTMNGTGPVPSRQDKPHPHSVFPDPTGNYLLSADLGADLIRIFSINQQTGALTSCPNAATGAGDGPRHGAWWAPSANSTAGQMLYIANELGNSVTTWQVSYPSGGCLTLKKVQSLPAYPQGKSAPSGSKTAEVHVAGNFAYVANRNDQSFGSQQDSIAAFTIDTSSGNLTYLDFTNAYSWFPRTFQINKAGTMVAIGGQTSANVAVVQRNVTTGKLGALVANLSVGSKGTDDNEDGLSSVIWNE